MRKFLNPDIPIAKVIHERYSSEYSQGIINFITKIQTQIEKKKRDDTPSKPMLGVHLNIVADIEISLSHFRGPISLSIAVNLVSMA